MRWRHVLLGALAAAIVVVTAVGVVELRKRQAAGDAVDIGGPFSMLAHDGRRVTEQDLVGRRSLIVFGFTPLSGRLSDHSPQGGFVARFPGR